MADFGYFSDTDDSAVDELISQAKELCVLEQVSAINCSGFTDSLLPTELDQRFRKLKSFPATKAKTPIKDDNTHEECHTFSASKENADGKMGLEPKSVPESDCDSASTDSKQNPDGKTILNEKSKSGSVSVPVPKLKLDSKSCSSPLSSSNSWMGSPSRSPSPPQKSGCLWCSPKSGSKNKSKQNCVPSLRNRSLDWDKSDELLSDLSTFSSKEQHKMLKKALKEQEKVSREAENIVNWAKQASMRMRVHDSEDELSDD